MSKKLTPFTDSSVENKDCNVDEYHRRRLLEMHRRLQTLQAKRFYLKNELNEVEKYLTSLDTQIKSLQ